MSDLLRKLGRNAQKGSKPRCHWLTHGTPDEAAARLTALIEPWGSVSVDDHWMPDGFESTDEAQLHRSPELFSTPDDCQIIRDWWFKIVRGGRQTAPSIDIASTCTVGGKKGIMIVEAKAHDLELIDEEKGKPLKCDPSIGEQRNHNHIGDAIANATQLLSDATGVDWSLSRDNRYQMSNRFATACKLAELGYAVIVVYLGFLGAQEMKKGKKQRALIDQKDWTSLVTSHSSPLFPNEVWNQSHPVHGQQIIPIIRSAVMPFDRPCLDVEFFRTEEYPNPVSQEKTMNNKNATIYYAHVFRRDTDAVPGYAYEYRIFVSDSDEPGYRVYSAVGPEGLTMKDQNLIPVDIDERSHLKSLVERWHPDRDDLNFGQK